MDGDAAAAGCWSQITLFVAAVNAYLVRSPRASLVPVGRAAPRSTWLVNLTGKRDTAGKAPRPTRAWRSHNYAECHSSTSTNV